MDTFQTSRMNVGIVKKVFMPGILCIMLSCVCVLSFGQNAEIRQNWQSEFSSQTPSPANLRAFEDRAVQKLNDLADYIKIISNKDLDQKLRQHAVKQALKLFHTESCTVMDPKFIPNSATVISYLDTLMKTEYHHVELEIVKNGITGPLVPVQDGSYRGSLQYSGSYKYFKNSNKPASKKDTTFKVEVILKKVKKSFGTSSSEIWVVYLGNFNL